MSKPIPTSYSVILAGHCTQCRGDIEIAVKGIREQISRLYTVGAYVNRPCPACESEIEPELLICDVSVSYMNRLQY